MTIDSHPPHPGVRFPPPLLFVAGLLGGWLLQRWLPLRLCPASFRGVAVAAGWMLIVAWFAVICWASLSFKRARTTVIPRRPANALVQLGPYQWTRNPMYLSMTGVYVGITLLLNAWWPLVLLPVVLYILRRGVIDREERYLHGAFGDSYEEYCRRVRRWL